jgi:hypothetical protein
MRTFRVALALGLGLVVGLGLLRLFPLALVLATAIVPLLLLLYLYDVDVYEDAPVLGVGATMLFGAFAGSVFGVVIEVVAPSGAAFLGGPSGERILVRGVLAPAIGFALMLLGPLLLLGDRRFDDVLDGTTFAAACAVTFVSSQVLVQSHDVLGAGVQPAGERWPWTIRLLELAVALPLLAAGAVGAVGGAIWLRHRAPIRQRHPLGVLARPPAAVGAALLLLIAAALSQLTLRWQFSSAVVAVLAAGALLWLRHVIHVGLLEESGEMEIGAPIACANCGKPTPRHTFCANCGVSLHALPKRREGR